jgi:hypothetical protein
MEPTTKVDIGDERSPPGPRRFVERLETSRAYQTVCTNFDIPRLLMEQLEASVVGG